jgi:ankyrin repeat protein
MKWFRYQHHHRILGSIQDSILTAVVDGNIEQLDHLYRNGGSVNMPIEYRTIPQPDITCDKRVKDTSIDAEHAERTGYTTALLVAAHTGQSDVLAWLLEKGADMHICLLQFGPKSPSAGETALHEAVLQSHKECASMLLQKDPNCVHNTDSLGRTPLFYAADAAIVNLLVGKGANVNGNNATYTVLGMAVHRNDKRVVHRLMELGAHVSQAPQNVDMNEILVAAADNNLDMIKYLIDIFHSTHVSVDIQDHAGMSAMHYAVQHGNVAFLQFLLNHTQETSLATAYGLTPLHVVLDKKPEFNDKVQLRMLNMLLEAGARVKAVDYYGRTPLHFAVVNSQLGYVDTLIPFLESGADPNTKDDGGHTPFSEAGHDGAKTRYLRDMDYNNIMRHSRHM